jgi:phage terminase large subunit
MSAAAVQKVVIDYRPRKWAKRYHAGFHRFAALVLHRRAGKTTAVINHHQRAATSDKWEIARLRHLQPDISDAHLKELLRYRFYAHILPQRNQAKITTWEMCKYYASFVPGAKPNESELRIDYPAPKGHVRRLQLFGADKIDMLRGVALAGLSMDEYGQHPPSGFSEVLSKALADHLGYVIFLGTIKGKNQLYKAWDAGRTDPTWFTLWQDVNASLAEEDDAAALMLRQAMHDDLELVKKGLMTQEEYDQEWFLSVEAAIRGAYYGRLIAAARKEGRITRVPYDPTLPVDTDWDIGVDDETSIWFSQRLKSGETRIIDFLHGSDQGLGVYIKLLKEKPYIYGQHWGPHDMEQREFTSGQTRVATAARLGIAFKITPKLSVADGIDAVRGLIPRCYFDEEKCAHGIEALTHYKKRWNEKLQQFEDEPYHDWSSHPADSFRGLAVRYRRPEDKRQAITVPRRTLQPPAKQGGMGWAR